MTAHTTAAVSSAPRLSVAEQAKGKAQESLRWAKHLLAKIARAIKGGWTAGIKFAKSFLAKYGSFAGIGAAAVMATKKGWHAVVKVARVVADTVRKGVSGFMRFLGKAVNWVGQKIGWAVGKVNSHAGLKVRGWSLSIGMHFTRAADRFDSFVGTAIEKVYTTAHSSIVTKIVNIASMVVLGAVAGQLLFTSQIAVQLATVPTVGPFLSSVAVGGPATFAALGGIGAAAIVYGRVFAWDSIKVETIVRETKDIQAEADAVRAEAKRMGRGTHSPMPATA